MKVIGFGDNVVDRYVNKNIMFPGGNAVNFAVYAKKNNIDAAYLGNFGDDMEADHIIFALKDLGISLQNCHRVFGTTTERFDVNLVEGDRVFIADDMRDTKPASFLLSNKDIQYLGSFDLVHSGCYAGVEDQIEKLKGLDSIVTFDFSVEDEFRTDSYLEKICPYIDMALFSCESMTIAETMELQRRVFNMGTKYILITKGTDGQLLFDGENYYSGVVRLVEATDTMGAGDSFFTTFVASLLKQGWKKQSKLTQDMICRAFEKAASFSADNCLTDGSFGYAKEIEEA